MTSFRDLKVHLDAFAHLCKQNPGPVPWSFVIQGNAQPHLLTSCLIHGNETGNLPGVLEFAQFLKKQTGNLGSVTFFLGNLEAAKQDRRFLEQDLNRVFLESAPPSLEKTRAQELMRLFSRDVSLYLDFHQTIEPTDRSFFTFPYHEELYNWARALKTCPTLVTRKPTESFATGLSGSSEYGRLQNIPSLTLETGEKGLRPESAELCFNTLKQAWRLLHLQKKDFQKEVSSAPDLESFVRVHAEPFSHPKMQLHAGFRNFQEIRKGEIVGTNGADSKQLAAPCDGWILFPKYPARHPSGEVIEPRPSDLYCLVQKRSCQDLKT